MLFLAMIAAWAAVIYLPWFVLGALVVCFFVGHFTPRGHRERHG